MIGQAEMDGATPQTGSESFNKLFVMQISSMNEHFHCQLTASKQRETVSKQSTCYLN